jgi:two-component system invasion response regulator UvrY
MRDNKPKILLAIADDHKIMLAGLRTVISLYDEFEIIIEANNGKILLDNLAKATPLPDICILDIRMDVMDGYETLKSIRNLYGQDIKVLVLTMHDEEYSILKMIKLGANGFLLKGADQDELYRALKDIYDKNFYSSELMSSSIIQRIHHNADFLPKITDKELVFLKYCCSELSYKDIAKSMGLSVKTIEGYCKSLCEKLDLHTRQGLVMFAFRTGLV